MRLIDADVTIDVVSKVLKGVFVEYEDIAEKMIGNIPAVDAVEVIRCKDCKHWEMVDLQFHKNICSKLMRPCNESDFCSRAERRQE